MNTLKIDAVHFLEGVANHITSAPLEDRDKISDIILTKIKDF